jgi:hypothetical protein
VSLPLNVRSAHFVRDRESFLELLTGDSLQLLHELTLRPVAQEI